MKPNQLRAASAIALVLFLAACTLAQITQVINAAVLIAEQAAAITGVNIPQAYLNYVSAASSCIAFAATEQASADSAAVKGTKITEQCAQHTSAALPPGTAQNLVTMAGKLAAAIQDILSHLPPPQAGLAASRSSPATAKSVSDADVRALKSLATRAERASSLASRKP